MQRRRARALAWWFATTLSLLAFAANATPASPRDEATALIADLEHGEHRYLFDMHGNADRRLRRLMVLRFDATPAIEAGIDRMERQRGKASLVEALYHVLGFVKDPASVPWLEEKLRAPGHASVYDAFLGHWQFRNGNSDWYGSWPWLEGRDRWIAFFLRAHGAERTADRRKTLRNALAGFDDPAVIRFFAFRRKAARDPTEILQVEAYLHQHDVPVDDARIASAIEALAGDRDNRPLLLDLADALRHPAFVPYLLRTVDVPGSRYVPTSFPSVDALERITFQVGIKDRAGWDAWYAKHRNETRDQWMQSAIAAFRTQLARDPVAAQQWFDKTAVYRWNDIAMLPFIRSDLLPRPDFRDDIAGWINLTYSNFHRPQLAPLGEEIARHPERLQSWAIGLLVGRGFLSPPEPDTWERYVALENSAI